jgi:hypothetical protein
MLRRTVVIRRRWGVVGLLPVMAASEQREAGEKAEPYRVV